MTRRVNQIFYLNIYFLDLKQSFHKLFYILRIFSISLSILYKKYIAYISWVILLSKLIRCQLSVSHSNLVRLFPHGYETFLYRYDMNRTLKSIDLKPFASLIH